MEKGGRAREEEESIKKLSFSCGEGGRKGGRKGGGRKVGSGRKKKREGLVEGPKQPKGERREGRGKGGRARL